MSPGVNINLKIDRGTHLGQLCENSPFVNINYEILIEEPTHWGLGVSQPYRTPIGHQSDPPVYGA